ncbi:unnamed protein product [Ceutorhynchus assimilis]|uniref:AXH domain-containing protein n=1 Tax=Ceutorhynchus assimilis TaxID=467358 RepID=A0A9N9MSE1_9CUCU|nr:unnamed protein product [Ceutorhynchus assimilis]
MSTKDFVHLAEKSPALRLAESTVVKIEAVKDRPVTITLTYDQIRAQVEVDSTPDHPYFVMGHGWASCNPDRTFHCYGLKVHKLQVEDVLVSLTPREPAAQPASTSTAFRSTTSMTTATTTAMSARQYSGNAAVTSTVTSATIPSNHFLSPASSPQANVVLAS